MRFLSLLLVLPGLVACARAAAPLVDGITFAEEPGIIHLPVEEAATQLKWTVSHDKKGGFIHLHDHAFHHSKLRHLSDGTPLVSLIQLATLGAGVTRDEEAGLANVGDRDRFFAVRIAPKRVEVNLADQTLRGWQGGRLVISSRISSGRKGTTPTGKFRAGPYKEAVHYSTRYRNARMPWSVQVTGNIFIHGFKAVPKTPASNGCIRLPLNEGNPAKLFFDWIDRGTPVEIRKN